MIYCANIPFLIGVLLSFFGVVLSDTVKFLTICYIANVINWICGYHWNLSMQSLERKTVYVTAAFSCLTLWAMYVAFLKDYKGASYILTAVLSLQIYWDFQPEVTYFISPHVKLARIMSTLMTLYFLTRILPL